MLKEEDILYEEGDYWVLAVKTGFEVYRNNCTHSVRCAQIGFLGDKGFLRAKAEIARRIADSRE